MGGPLVPPYARTAPEESKDGLTIAFTPDGLSRQHGGVKRYADELSTRFVEGGHRVHVTGGGVPAWRGPRRLRVGASHLRELVRPTKADVVFAPFLDIPARVPPGTPVVATIHDLTGFHFPRPTLAGRLSRAMLRRALDRADHLICDSEATRTDVIAQGVDANRTTVVPLGVDPAFAKAPPSPTSSHRPIGPSVVLYVGKRHGYKDFDLVRRALGGDLFAAEPVELWIVGGEPMTDQELAELQDLSGVTRVLNLGNVEDEQLVARYHEADVCLITSKYEGFGLPALEAMAAGCPLASSTGGSLAEIVVDRAHTFEPGDAPGCTRAVSAAIAAGRHDPLVAEGQKFATAFTWERTAVQTLEILTKVVDDARR